jgi:hypothetical protein
MRELKRCVEGEELAFQCCDSITEAGLAEFFEYNSVFRDIIVVNIIINITIIIIRMIIIIFIKGLD